MLRVFPPTIEVDMDLNSPGFSEKTGKSQAKSSSREVTLPGIKQEAPKLFFVLFAG